MTCPRLPAKPARLSSVAVLRPIWKLNFEGIALGYENQWAAVAMMYLLVANFFTMKKVPTYVSVALCLLPYVRAVPSPGMVDIARTDDMHQYVGES